MIMIDMTRPRNVSVDSGHASSSSESSFGAQPTAGVWEGKDASRQWVPAEDTATPRRRTLILCFDGTAQQFDADNSNVVQFTAMLRKDDTSKQLVYYQTGIGTYTSPLVIGDAAASVVKTLDDMFAISLPDHIKGVPYELTLAGFLLTESQEGYEFLMQNYSIGDKVCIFGFSRGAYTARALAGMIQKVGLLSKDNCQQLPFAYSMYARDDLEGLQLSIMFKRTFSIDVKIEFLGVWDTVASVGLVDRDLPFVGTNNAIRYFRHALALDEHRAKFMPSFYVRPQYSEKEVDKESQMNLDHVEESYIQEYEEKVNGSCLNKTDALEVWFAGAHCDVGGGSVPNNSRHSLARISLRWMIRECFRTNTGILFDAKMLQNEVGLELKTLDDHAPARIPAEGGTCTLGPEPPRDTFLLASHRFIRTTIKFPFQLIAGLIRPSKIKLKADFSLGKRSSYIGEAEEELRDALSPIYDELRTTWWWRILEWIPLRHKKQKANANPVNDRKEYIWSINKGRGRKVFNYIVDSDSGMKVHRSVKTRLEALDAQGQSGTYVPRIRTKFFNRSRRAEPFTHKEWNIDCPEFCEWVD